MKRRSVLGWPITLLAHISLLYLSPLSVRPSVRLSSGEDVAMMAARVRRRVSASFPSSSDCIQSLTLISLLFHFIQLCTALSLQLLTL